MVETTPLGRETLHHELGFCIIKMHSDLLALSSKARFEAV